MKQTSKPVSSVQSLLFLYLSITSSELDALGLEEEETPSYLTDMNAAPDFLDEAPVESSAVSMFDSREGLRINTLV